MLGDAFVCTSSLTKSTASAACAAAGSSPRPTLAEKMWRLNELFGVAQAHAAERLSCLALARLDEVAAETPALLARNRALANAFFAGRERARSARR